MCLRRSWDIRNDSLMAINDLGLGRRPYWWQRLKNERFSAVELRKRGSSGLVSHFKSCSLIRSLKRIMVKIGLM